MPVLESLFITVILLFAIVGACSVFTNGIEWLGHRFKLSQGAVGSVLAAVGTALPETIVPAVALLGTIFNPELSYENAGDISVGAILGAPFLLSTLAMFLVAVTVFYLSSIRKRGLVLNIDLHLFKRDLSYFFSAYSMVFIASFIPYKEVKWAVALIILVIYASYVYRTLKIEHIPDEEFHLEPLIAAPKNREPNSGLILLQTFVGLAGIVLMAHLFVQQINRLSTLLEISPLLLSLIISPVATELPEMFNSITWISKKKDNLALGNITGAMVFQSCIPPVIGLLFTPWILDSQGILSVMLCFTSAASVYIYVYYRGILTPRILLLPGLFYLIFLFYSITRIMRD